MIQRADRLRGIWGVLEGVSVVCVLAAFYYLVVAAKPEVMTPGARLFYGFLGVCALVGGLGVGYTQLLRSKVRRHPELRQRYMEDRADALPTRGGSDLVKENWSPLKRWLVLFAVGILIWAAFIGAVLLTG